MFLTNINRPRILRLFLQNSLVVRNGYTLSSILERVPLIIVTSPNCFESLEPLYLTKQLTMYGCTERVDGGPSVIRGVDLHAIFSLSCCHCIILDEQDGLSGE